MGYGSIISCCVLNILFFKVQIDSWNDFSVAVLNDLGNPAFLRLLGGRMLFNLKRAGGQVVYGDDDKEETYTDQTLSDIQFS